MKIICTSKEFATLIRACERRNNSPEGCKGCIFLSICASSDGAIGIEEAAKFEVRGDG